jgi:hypothetical protein
MSQNARLAQWIPTTDDADPGEVVNVTGISGTGRIIPTVFGSASPARSARKGRKAIRAIAACRGRSAPPAANFQTRPRTASNGRARTQTGPW